MKFIKFTILLSALLIANYQSIFCVEKLIWAADAESNAPYIFKDPNNPDRLIGFEKDIIEEIAKRLNMKAEFFQNQWDGLIPGLARNDYNLAINGLEITEDREEVVNFSTPYYITSLQLVIESKDYTINSKADLIGKRLGVLKASYAEKVANSMKGITVKTYEGEVNAFMDMDNGRLDAVLVDAPIAIYYASWNKKYRFIDDPIGNIGYGIVMKKSDSLMLKKINKVIDQMIQSGKLREILESWKLWNKAMAVFTVDFSERRFKPTNYQYFVKTQEIKTSLISKLSLYYSFLPSIAKAAWTTLEITIFSMLLAIFIGLILAIVRIYAPQPFSALAVAYIELIRGTPLLIQLFFIFYALPTIGVKLSPFFAAIIGLGLNYAAYEAENYRAGIMSIHRGQMEAALSLGMTRKQALRYVILPQAIRLVIPPITNDFISLLKDSSLVSVITLVELTKLYGQLATTYYDFIGTGVIIAFVYLVLGLPFVKLAKFVENKFSYDKKKVF